MIHGLTRGLILLAAVGLTGACKPGEAPSGTAATPSQIKDKIDQSQAPLTLVHLWATWCDPCREEFPEVLQAYRDKKDSGLSLLLVSADEPGDLEAVDQFLREHRSPEGSLVSTELDQDFIELFSTNWSGALPASFFYDADGTLLAEWEGMRSYEDYIATIDGLLKK